MEKEITEQKQKSGDNSTNQQAGGDINNINISKSIVLYSVEEVSKKLLESSFGELPDSTKENIRNNQKSYFNILTENLSKIVKQGEDLNNIINSPDFQYTSKLASISASRSSSIELHKNLSLLIIERINNDDNDLKRIVYNEAINTINKLTIDQLKILTLSFLITRTTNNMVRDQKSFSLYLDKMIKPFIDFNGSQATFEHLIYAGCASIIRFSVSTLESILLNNYNNILNNTVISNLLLTDATFIALKDKWDSTLIRSMDLTSVGIVIASIFYEQIVGIKINIDIWIN